MRLPPAFMTEMVGKFQELPRQKFQDLKPVPAIQLSNIRASRPYSYLQPNRSYLSDVIKLRVGNSH